MVEIPGYKVLRQLGRGGMATVYLAEQAMVEREVALKVMAPQLTVDPSFGERFLREARIAAKLRHPNIVSVIEVGVHGDYHYAAMEYLSGGPIVARDDTLGLLETLRAVREIATALDYAHSKGVVHRDVKPDNILVRDDGSAVLGDFGIARAVDASGAVTRTGTVVGTPLYMSPEQLRGKHVDGRSDLYSLGVVCFQLLSGRPPYTAEDALALGIMHMTSPIPALPSVFQRAQPLVSKLLAKDPADRYQSGAGVVAAVVKLEAALSEAGYAPERLLHPESALEPAAVQPSDSHLHRNHGGRAEPTIGEMNEAVADRWRVTPRPLGKQRRRRWGLPLLLLIVMLAALGWWQQALWWPQAQQWVEAQLGAQDVRLAEFSQRRERGELYAADGNDGLLVLAGLLKDKPGDAQALGALAAAWPTLLDQLDDLDATDSDGARALRNRLLALRPNDPALRASADPRSADVAAVLTNAADVQTDASPSADAEPSPTSAGPALTEEQINALMAEQLSAARAAERERRWYGDDGALAAYQSALQFSPQSAPARVGLLRLIDRVLIDAREALQRRQEDQPVRAAVEALATIDLAAGAHAELVRLLELADRRGAGADRVQRISAAISSAEKLLRGRTPSDQALLELADQLTAAARLDRRDPRLRETIDKVAAMLLVRAGERVEANQRSAAEDLLGRARSLTPDSAQLEDLQIRIQQSADSDAR